MFRRSSAIKRSHRLTEGLGRKLVSVTLVWAIFITSLPAYAAAGQPSPGALTWSVQGANPGRAFTAFGPQIYRRERGEPHPVSNQFSVLNPVAPYTLRVESQRVDEDGDRDSDPHDAFARARILLNGKQIVSSEDFERRQDDRDKDDKGKKNRSIATLMVEKPVALLANNNISVEVEGRSGTSVTVTITGLDNDAPVITASANPAANSFGWNNTNVVVTFVCSDRTSGVASCPAPVTLSTEGANQVVHGTATDRAGNTASTSVAVSIDKTPPVLNITSPANNSTVATSTLQISGNVTDALSGVSSTTCNGIPGAFQNGTFTCSTILTPGANTVNVAATDKAGNTATKSVSVTLGGGSPVIRDFNPTSGPAGTLITVNGSNFTGGTNPQVILNQQGGGTIAAPVTSFTNTNLTFVIPPGAASGTFTITSAGSQGISPSALTITASSSFNVTASPNTANVIQGKTGAYAVTLNSGDGFSQLAQLSVSGVPAGVTASFSPTQITASQISTLTVTAPAGQLTGNTVLTITASATIDGIPTNQSTTVNLAVQPVTTSLIGRVLESDTIESPLGGITITLLGVDDTGHATGCAGQTISDAGGNFSFTNLPAACAGRQLVGYNGNTASDGEKYASVNLAYTIAANQVTGPEFVHLPRIDNGETKMVQQNAPFDQVFTFSTLPGVAATVYAGTVFTLPDGTQPNPFPFTGVSVPVDRLPDAPKDGAGALRAYIIAFQPADSTTNQPVAVTFPNTLNTPPGVNMELDTLDPVRGELVKYGTGTVSGDGTQIVPDPDPNSPGHNFGIVHFDWHGPMAPGPNDKNPCPGGNCPDGGDPVDLASGLFVLTKTDLSFSSARGTVAMTRTYRPLSGAPGPFGVGTNHNYGYQLNTFSFLQQRRSIGLITPDGNQFPLSQQPDGTLANSSIPSLIGSSLTPNFGFYDHRLKDGTIYRFQPPSTGPRVAYLSAIIDPNGNTTTLIRGNQNSPIQITQIIDPVGRALTINYDNFDRITSIVDPIGRTVSYTYNAQGRLATVTDAAGGVTTYLYDSQNRMSQIIDPRGIAYIQNTYDQDGKVIQQVDANGAVTKFDYTLLNPNVPTSPVLLTTVTDPLGNRTTYHFSPLGFLLDVTDSFGDQTIYSLDPQTNLPLSVTDALNRTTQLTYDSRGNLTSSTKLAGTPNAVTTSFTYDPVFSRLTSITNPLQQTTSLAYDGNGNLTSATDPLGHGSTFTYDQFGEPLQVTDALGNQVQFTYTNGSPTTITDPSGNVLNQAFDGAGRVVSRTTALGQTVRYSYTSLNKLSQITNPTGGATSFIYDPNGNLLQVTDSSSHTLKYTYDLMDRKIGYTDPLSRSESYLYDANGNLTQFTDRRGKVLTYKYDALSRRVVEGFGADGNGNFESTVSYQYDAVGRLLRAVDSSAGAIIEGYDVLDRLVSQATPRGSVNYSYDAADRRIGMNVTGQPPISYSYDNADRLTNITQAASVVKFTYDDANRRTSLLLPNGVAASYSFDQNSRLTGITYQAGSRTLGNLTYAYDGLGRRTQVGGTLAQTSLPKAIDSASYDAANELINWNGTSINYDANGNVLFDGSNNFKWNARNQLASLNGANSVYDALGRRVQNFQGTSFVYDYSNIVQELHGSTPVANRLAGNVDEFFQRSDTSGSFSPMLDALGSVLALTDSSGTQQTRYAYDPFGNTSSTGTANSNPFQYTGRENEGSGLYFYRDRYYSPALHRFVSEDSTGFSGFDFNLYGYTGDSPTNLTDPSGDIPLVPIIIGGIGAAWGAIDEGSKAYDKGCRGWDLAKAIGRGALAGGVGSVVGLWAAAGLGPAGGGAVASITSDVINNAFTGDWNGTEMARNAAIGALSGGLADRYGPVVRGGSNFQPFSSPRFWGPRAQQAYRNENASDALNLLAKRAADAAGDKSGDLSGRKNGNGDNHDNNNCNH
ncbi:MAG TPA: RHS repeat-associated core domain-containing protein [Candidatus Angelobacter sp.]|jgi:RHS repeat-associated protein|nr:RHS repeat-associated core domain-containing protein [Candidatus Angelobacter sp.]